MNAAPAVPDPAVIRTILEGAINAPSGDNSQPWRFRIGESDVTIYNVADADETQYNFRQRGSYVAHGALIENIRLVAATFGFDGSASLFPGEPAATARITFAARHGSPDPLASAVPRRATNRKPYRSRPLAAADRAALSLAAAAIAGTELRLVESPAELDAIARSVSVNERLLMENRALHDFLFGMIRWTRREEAARPGLYIDTMELPSPVRLLFRFVVCHWPVVRALNLIGFSRFIPTRSAPVYRASSAFGAIILAGDTDADFIAAGRAFERVWLAATAAGLALQPTAALPYLVQRLNAGAAGAFSVAEQDLIRGAYAPIARAFGLSGAEHIAMLFRLGYADAPSATSAKMPPAILDRP